MNKDWSENCNLSQSTLLCEDEKILFHELVKYFADGNFTNDEETISKSEINRKKCSNIDRNRNNYITDESETLKSSNSDMDNVVNHRNKKRRSIKVKISMNDPRKYYIDRITTALNSGDHELLTKTVTEITDEDGIVIQRFSKDIPGLPLNEKFMGEQSC